MKLNRKNIKELFMYLVFGVLTTLVNILTFVLCTRVVNCTVVISNIIAWFVSVFFAYVTNRKFVFNSQKNSLKQILKEACFFYAGRIGTGVLDTFLMFLSVDVLNLNDILMKVIVNGIVIILNYIVSKFMIFRKNDDAESE